MKYFLISDNVDTLDGMRLVGVRGVVAVSYTHLDVYKRQAFSRRALRCSSCARWRRCARITC